MSKNMLISLIGGEPTGNYRAYKEFMPSVLIHVFSEKTKTVSDRILSLVDKKQTQIIEVPIEGDNYANILKRLHDIPFEFASDDYLNINVTGGTKMMSLAALEFGKTLENRCNVSFLYTDIESQTIHWFYKNKSETFCDDLELEEHIALAGQKIKSKDRYEDLRNKFEDSMNEIKTILNSRSKKYPFQDFLSLFVREVAKKSELNDNKQKAIFSYYTDCLDKIKRKGFQIEWSNSCFKVYYKEELFIELKQTTQEIDWFVFNAGWFELLTAEKLAKKYVDSTIYMNVKFPLLEKIDLDKNEVDVLILQNGKMIFVECKSGVVLPKDINNMKVRQETYGGIGAKNLLVTRFDLSEGKLDFDKLVLEKCNDLKIEVKSFNKL